MRENKEIILTLIKDKFDQETILESGSEGAIFEILSQIKERV